MSALQGDCCSCGLWTAAECCFTASRVLISSLELARKIAKPRWLAPSRPSRLPSPQSPLQVKQAVVVITVDLSDPSNVLPTLLQWMRLIHAKLDASYSLFTSRGMQLPEQLKQRAKLKFWGGHPDKDAVKHSGISIVVAATKYDAFQNQDSECRKVRLLEFLNGTLVQRVSHRSVTWMAGIAGFQSSGVSRAQAMTSLRPKAITDYTYSLCFPGIPT